MRSAGKFAGCSQPTKSCLGKGTLKGCTTSGKGDNIVLIDVESEDIPECIIIDIPESLKRKLGKGSVDNVINIDDDDEDDDADTVGSCNMENDSTTSNRGFEMPASSHPARSDGESCQFVREGGSPVNLSKCKRTYSGKSGNRNRYGLTSESERSLSDSDCSDCECMEDSFGKLHEQWEKASSKRKYDIRNGRPGPDHQAGPSASHPISENSSREEHAANRVESSNPCSMPRTTYENGSTSSFAFDDDGRLRNNMLNQEKGNPSFAHVAQEKAEQEPFSQTNSTDNQRVWPDGYFPNFSEQLSPKQFDGCPSSFCSKEQGAQDTTISPTAKVGVPHDNEGQHFPKDTVFEPCNYNRQLSFDEISDCHTTDAHDEEVSSSPRCRSSVDVSFNYCYVPSVDDADEPLATSGSQPCENNGSSEPENSMARECLFKDFNLYNGSMANFTDIKSTCQKARNTVPTDSLRNSLGCQSTVNIVDNSEVQARDTSGALALDEENDASGFHSTDCSRVGIITDRQKIKDTDEYKRALEEELEARRQQLQIQAEEAQRLRKRKKAEAMRITDMERRQKQRVNEIRETLKKDEENMNLKERIRAEVRKQLKTLETSCDTMTSLLRSLEIHVAGGFFPSTQEVQTAYKRAVLKFHPDRVPGGDLRHQIEAEEKFKLISRLKEKLSNNGVMV